MTRSTNMKRKRRARVATGVPCESMRRAKLRERAAEFNAFFKEAFRDDPRVALAHGPSIDELPALKRVLMGRAEIGKPLAQPILIGAN